MEAAITAVAGELVSRLISFALTRYWSSDEDEGLEEKREKIQRLLMRVHTVVEEADARYITNSGMLMQLKTLSEAMYRGYHALDSSRFYREESFKTEVSNSFISSSSATRLKRPRTVTLVLYARKDRDLSLEVHAAMENLETVVANMPEFVAFLCGCERLSRRPYDAYLYISNFMFSRHAEKQKLLNFLLQQPNPDDDAPPVLPIIGGRSVGKKTLVAHVCADERVRSNLTSVLHLNGDNFLNIINNHEEAMMRTSLVVVEFASDVDDVEWNEFYSFVRRINSTRVKVIIISKLGRLARFGSVRPIILDALSYEELWYLLQEPSIWKCGPGRTSTSSIYSSRNCQGNASGWITCDNKCVCLCDGKKHECSTLAFHTELLQKSEREGYLFASGQHPDLLFEQGREVDLTDMFPNHVNPLRIIPYTSSNSTTYALGKELPMVALGDLLLDPSVRPDRPKDNFVY